MSQFETVSGLDSIEMSPSLRDSLQRAISYAYEQSHRQVTLEHLLLALVEDRDAAVILEASAISVPALMTDVSGYLGQLDDRVGEGQLRRPDLGGDVRHIIQSAGAAAQKSKRRAVSSALVLAAVVGDGRSPAAQLLRKHGLTFENAISALKQANASQSAKSATRPATPPEPAPSAPNVASAAPASPPSAPAGVAHVEPAAPTNIPTPTLASSPVAMPANPPPPGSGSASRLQNMQAAHEIIAGARERIAAARGAIATRSPEPSDSPATAPPPKETPRYTDQASDTPPVTRPPANAAPPSQVPPPPEDTRRQDHPMHPSTGQPDALQNGLAATHTAPMPSDRPEAPPPPHNPASNPPLPTDSSRDGAAAPKLSPPPKLAPPPAFEPAPPPGNAKAVPSAPGGPPPSNAAPASHALPSSTPPPRPDRSPLPMAPAMDPTRQARPELPPGRAPAGRSMPPGPGPQANGQPQPALTAGAQGRSAPVQPPQRLPDEVPHYPQPPAQRPSPPTSGAPVPSPHAPLPRAVPPSPMPQPPVMQGQLVAPEATPIEPELLIQDVPTRMRVDTPTTIEIRAPRARLEAWSGGSLDPRARDDHIIMKAMVMRLKAPEGGFTVEVASPETQWSEGYTGPLSDDVVSWRWVVTPSVSGRLPLQLSVATRVVGRDGLAAARVLPEQLVTVRVAPNFARIANRVAMGMTLLVSGLIVGYFADSLFSIGSSVLALQ